jgi:hypothetical protein
MKSHLIRRVDVGIRKMCLSALNGDSMAQGRSYKVGQKVVAPLSRRGLNRGQRQRSERAEHMRVRTVLSTTVAYAENALRKG